MPVLLSGERARSWTSALAVALGALRLNQHFPPWERLAAWLRVMGERPIRMDTGSGLPAPREWVRLRMERELADAEAGALSSLDIGRLPPAEASDIASRRRRLASVMALEPLPPFELRIALRNRDRQRASYLAVVDRFDVATATVARYTLILSDAPGQIASHGELELRASAVFASHLELLATQDASLAFAVLRERQGIEVEDVVRGVVGPGVLPGEGGPEPLRNVNLGGPALSACLERASLDLKQGRVDDPIAAAVVVPGLGEEFGVSRTRKWAVPHSGREAMKGWLASLGSRNLVYGY